MAAQQAGLAGGFTLAERVRIRVHGEHELETQHHGRQRENHDAASGPADLLYFGVQHLLALGGNSVRAVESRVRVTTASALLKKARQRRSLPF